MFASEWLQGDCKHHFYNKGGVVSQWDNNGTHFYGSIHILKEADTANPALQ